MNQSIGYITFVVRDYDEAIAYFTYVLQFILVEDRVISDEKRWVLVGPNGTGGTKLLLAKGTTPNQKARIGDQTGGRVSFFLHTDDLARDYPAMKSRGVQFTEEPRSESYGRVVVFEDLYGNRWDLLELKTASPE